MMGSWVSLVLGRFRTWKYHALPFGVKIVARHIAGLAIILLLANFFFRNFHTRLFPLLDAFDRVSLLVAALAAILLPAVALDTQDKLRRLEAFGTSTSYVTVLGGLAIVVWAWIAKEPSVAAILSSGLFATLGWIITQRNTRKASRKQHTFNLLLELRKNANFDYHIANIYRMYPPDVRLPIAHVERRLDERTDWKKYDGNPNAKPTLPIIESVLWIANLYEFIAVGILNGDLDEQFMKESYRGMFCRYYSKVRPIIETYQKVDADGRPTVKVYENIYELFNRWANSKEQEASPKE
jgi:hypothetical protein